MDEQQSIVKLKGSKFLTRISDYINRYAYIKILLLLLLLKGKKIKTNKNEFS